MALNIKNPRTHALVRELAERTGLSLTSAVEDAVTRRLAELAPGQGSPERLERARMLVDAYHQDMGATELVSIRAAAEDLYDEAGLPR